MQSERELKGCCLEMVVLFATTISIVIQQRLFVVRWDTTVTLAMIPAIFGASKQVSK